MKCQLLQQGSALTHSSVLRVRSLLRKGTAVSANREFGGLSREPSGGEFFSRPFRGRNKGITPRIREKIAVLYQVIDYKDFMAESEGFEPPVPFQAQRFSRPPVSTAHPALREGGHCFFPSLLQQRLRSPVRTRYQQVAQNDPAMEDERPIRSKQRQLLVLTARRRVWRLDLEKFDSRAARLK